MLTEAGESEARIMTLKNARSREGRAAPAADGTSTPARVSGSSDVIPVSGRAAGAGMVTWYVATILKDARTAAVAAASSPQRVEAACPSEEEMVRGEAGKPSAGCSSTGLSGDQPSAPTAVRRKQEPSQPWRRKGKNESRRWGGGGVLCARHLTAVTPSPAGSVRRPRQNRHPSTRMGYLVGSTGRTASCL